MAATAALTARFSGPWNTENKSWCAVTAQRQRFGVGIDKGLEGGATKYFAPHAKREVNI